MVGSSLRIFACLHAHPHIDWSISWSPVQQSILTGVRPLVNKQAQQGRICGSMCCGACTCGLMITTDMDEGLKPLMAHQTKPQYFMACNSGIQLASKGGATCRCPLVAYDREEAPQNTMSSQGSFKAAIMPPAARSAQYDECDQTQALSRLCDTSSLLELWHTLRMNAFAVSPHLAAHVCVTMRSKAPSLACMQSKVGRA